jgi:hypothetical protein
MKVPAFTSVPKKQSSAIPSSAAPAAAAAAASTAVPTAAAEFILNGVFFSEGNGYALINNQIVRKDDTIGNAKVIAVVADGVELEIRGKQVKITLQK